jgi:site-specific recombinase XerD
MMSQPRSDSLQDWINYYLKMAVDGVRSDAVSRKIKLHLNRFQAFFEARYGQEAISSCVKRDVVAWQKYLQNQDLAAATINNHLASLSGFTTWVHAQNKAIFVMGDPTKGIGELSLPPLEPRALTKEQVQSLKNLCDRLLPFYRAKGRKWLLSDEEAPLRTKARPWRDRAIVFVLLSTGLRREELVNLNLSQLSPNGVEELRQARRAQINGVVGKGKTQRDVFLSLDARRALADYLEKEYPDDVSTEAEEDLPLFLVAIEAVPRRTDGRLSSRSVNYILEKIGKWHDTDIKDEARHISPLRPHDLRHTFAFQLAQVTGADSYELERRLGHQSQRYIQRYTNPPEDIAASYIEEF